MSPDLQSQPQAFLASYIATDATYQAQVEELLQWANISSEQAMLIQACDLECRGFEQHLLASTFTVAGATVCANATTSSITTNNKQ